MRFDLDSGCGEGTCYIASDDMGAMRETLGPEYDASDLLPASFFGDRRIWKLVPKKPWEGRIANLRTNWWSGFGLTNELFSITPYDIPQAWARSLRKITFDGLCVALRHLPDPSQYGLAIFGRQGMASADVRFTIEDSTDITNTETTQFTIEFNIEFEATPQSEQSLNVLN